jgi:hypothetical protein
MPAVRGPCPLGRRPGAGGKIELGKIRCHGKTEVLDPRSIPERVTPALRSARFVGHDEFSIRARRQSNSIRNSFRGFAIPSRRFAVDCKREVAIAGIGRGKFKAHVDRLRNLRRILDGVFAAKIHQVSAIPEQPFFLRLIAQLDRDIALRRLDQMAAVRAPRRVVIGHRVGLKHDWAPAAGHVWTAVTQRSARADNDAGPEDEPADGRADNDAANGEKSSEGHER